MANPPHFWSAPGIPSRAVKHWQQPTGGTPDHFAACSNQAGVPTNRFGVEAALEGESYGGLVLFSRAKWRYREYLTTPLSRTLSPGEWICISFWYSAAEQAGVVADGLGVLLSEDKPTGVRARTWGMVKLQFEKVED